MFMRRRLSHHSAHIWPTFVDIMASVLMVLLFVLMTFILSQFYLSDTLRDRNEDIARLESKIKNLLNSLGQEKNLRENLSQKNTGLEENLQTLQTEIKRLNDLLSLLTLEKNKEHTTATSFEEKLKRLQEDYNTLEAKTKEDLSKLKLKHEKLDKIEQYRSKFFDKLLKVMKNRQDIRIVGDRFVFESEVLFDVASAKLNKDGAKQLDSLVETLNDISTQIPKDVEWVLRIDGHTDNRPIKTQEFPSNWELSAARAISVVKYLNSKGVDSSRLMAAGFSEHQPITSDESERARNRRIEFRFDLLR